MKISILPLYQSAIICAVAMLFLAGCASNELFRQSYSTLPIKVLDSTGGEISRTRAFETATKLYVTGNMLKHAGYSLGVAAHIDIQLIDGAGNVIAEESDDIDPTHPLLSNGRSGRYSYVVSFPLEVAKNASLIQVAYHRSAH